MNLFLSLKVLKIFQYYNPLRRRRCRRGRRVVIHFCYSVFFVVVFVGFRVALRFLV